MNQDDLMPACSWGQYAYKEGPNLQHLEPQKSFLSSCCLSKIIMMSGDPSGMQYGTLTVVANTIMCETKLNRWISNVMSYILCVSCMDWVGALHRQHFVSFWRNFLSIVSYESVSQPFFSHSCTHQPKSMYIWRVQDTEIYGSIKYYSSTLAMYRKDTPVD